MAVPDAAFEVDSWPLPGTLPPRHKAQRFAKAIPLKELYVGRREVIQLVGKKPDAELCVGEEICALRAPVCLRVAVPVLAVVG